MLALLLACDAGFTSGAGEPIVVREGTFFEGDLPSDETAVLPEVIYAASTGYVLTQGQGSIGYDGLASADAFSVAVSFPDVSTGYWVVPVDGPDATQDNNLLFDLTVDLSRDAPYGLTSLAFSAIDGDGHPGPRYDAQLCVLPDFADGNYAACDAETPPQHTILSLYWTTDVDLDLVVVTPAGQVVDPTHPSTAVDQDDESSIGVLTRDSNDGCDIDSVRLESLVFEEEPPAGVYEVYADLFSPCGERSVDFELSLFTRVEEEDGTWSIDRADLASGSLLGSQADAGASLGTHLATVSLP